VVVLDVDEGALQRCVARYNKQKLASFFGLSAVAGDAGRHDLGSRLPSWRYDVVSCFRGLQYAFKVCVVHACLSRQSVSARETDGQTAQTDRQTGCLTDCLTD
jgi:hypothetical protein